MAVNVLTQPFFYRSVGLFASDFRHYSYWPLQSLVPDFITITIWQRIQICGNIPVAVMSKAFWDGGFESRGGMDVCLLWVMCFVTQRSLWQPDHLSRGFRQGMVNLSVVEKPHRRGLSPRVLSNHEKNKVWGLLMSFFPLECKCNLLSYWNS